MKLQILAVRDVKMAAFARPFFAPTVNTGIRAFGDSVRDKESSMNKHPEDYALYALGEFDDETGEFRTENPRQVSLASEFVFVGESGR